MKTTSEPTAGYTANTTVADYQTLLTEAGDACTLCPEKYLPRSGHQLLARAIGDTIVHMTEASIEELRGDETLGQGWLLSMNSFPYPHTAGRVDATTPTRGHMLILPERHLTNPSQLKDHDDYGVRGRDHYFDLFDVARETYGAHLGGLTLRFYDAQVPWPADTARADGHEAAGLTLPHLHGHILVPHLDPTTGYTPGHGTPELEDVLFSIG